MSLSIAAEPIPLREDGDGVFRVGGTRVTLDTLIGAFLDGATAEEIVQRYTSLELADVYAVLGFYLRHRGEVDAYLRRREDESARVRRENEARFSPHGIRERLMARRRQPESG